MRRRLFWLVTLIPLLLVVAMVLWPRLASRPKLGVTNDRLTPCPDRPNCVCSQDEADDHHVDALPIRGGVRQSLLAIEQILRGMRRTRITEQTDDYIRAEVRSAWVGFVDDVEFLADRDASVIHCRSASRVGYSDLGVNRKRMEAIRDAYLKTDAEVPEP